MCEMGRWSESDVLMGLSGIKHLGNKANQVPACTVILC